MRFLFWVLVLSAAPCRAQDVSVIQPVKPGLVAVPMPGLGGLEAAVADQIREQRQSFEQVATRAKVADRDLANAYTSLGRLTHAYEFFDAAEASYANAIRLTPQDPLLRLRVEVHQRVAAHEQVDA